MHDAWLADRDKAAGSSDVSNQRKRASNDAPDQERCLTPHIALTANERLVRSCTIRNGRFGLSPDGADVGGISDGGRQPCGDHTRAADASNDQPVAITTGSRVLYVKGVIP